MRHRKHKYGAGYRLSAEVKAPTPSLLRAAQIGVLRYDAPIAQSALDAHARAAIPAPSSSSLSTATPASSQLASSTANPASPQSASLASTPAPSQVSSSTEAPTRPDSSTSSDASASDKAALLVLSYGASTKESAALAIEPTIREIAEANPTADIFQAYSSQVMINHMKSRAGEEMPTLAEALETLIANGYTRVAITTTHFLPGVEYERAVETFNAYKSRFRRLVLGTPLLYWMGQEDQRDDVADFVAALRESLDAQAADEAVLFMAHGTLHPTNAFYTVMQGAIESAGWQNAFVYTINGHPRLMDVVPLLKSRGIKRVRLVPLMMAVGIHVTRDMAGDGDKSHKHVLEREGFDVTLDTRGLGEREAVRRLYVERANEAWDALMGEGVATDDE